MLIRKLLIVLLIFSLFVWSCKSSAGVQNQKNLPRVENVRFTQKQDTINVVYDLLSRSYKTKFNVDLLLVIGEKEAYTIDSNSVTGDVGKNTLPGRNNQIKWAVLKDFPRGIQGKNFQFIVEAEAQSGAKKTWLYIAAGVVAAVALGGIIAMIAGSSGGDGGLPTPPDRPGSQ